MSDATVCPDPWLLCAACGEPHRDAYIAPTGAYGLCGGCLTEAIRDIDADLDYPDEMTAIVTDPSGKTWRVVVTVEQTITLTAHRPEEVAE